MSDTIETTIRKITEVGHACPYEAVVQRGDTKWVHRFTSLELADAFALGCRVAFEATGCKTTGMTHDHR